MMKNLIGQIGEPVFGLCGLDTGESDGIWIDTGCIQFESGHADTKKVTNLSSCSIRSRL